MKWLELNSIDQLKSLEKESFSQPVIILKHSTRCHISKTILKKFEHDWQPGDEEKIKPYFLDLLKHRDVSDEMAKRYMITHQSPQLVTLKNGKEVYHASHHEIEYDELLKKL